MLGVVAKEDYLGMMRMSMAMAAHAKDSWLSCGLVVYLLRGPRAEPGRPWSFALRGRLTVMFTWELVDATYR